jgi:hypothetical protein
VTSDILASRIDDVTGWHTTERYVQRSLFSLQTVSFHTNRIQWRMAFIVIKTIKGRQYRYQQRTYREGGKVRTETIYLGPVDGGKRRAGVLRRVNAFLKANFPPRYGLPDEEAMLRNFNERAERERKEREKAIVLAHDLNALTLSDTPPSTAASDQGNAPAEETSTDFNAPTSTA